MKRITSMILLLIAGAILTQGFQCASREMSTAKQKFSIKEYADAEVAVNQELAKNPANDEAKVLLFDILKEQDKEKELIAVINKYQEDLVMPTMKDKFQSRVYMFWTGKYQDAMKAYTKATKKKPKKINPKELDKAIKNMETVLAIRPNLPAPYESLGTFYDEYSQFYKNKGNTQKAEEAFEKSEDYFDKYYMSNKENFDFAAEKGFYLYMDRNELLKKIGKPVKVNGNTDPNGNLDSTYFTTFKVGDTDLYTYSLKEKNKPAKLYGWRVNPPAYWKESEATLLLDVRDYPLRSLAFNYYDKEDWKNALKYTKRLMELTPEAKDVRPLLIELYRKTNQTEKLVKEVRTMIDKDPNDALGYSFLGDVYRLDNKFDKSIEAYKKAVELDKSLVEASLNLAVAYQNQAAEVAKKESQKAQKDENYEVKTELYEPTLNKAVNLYTNVIKSPKYENDPDVYVEIINIYWALQKLNEMKKYVTMLEKIETSLTKDQKMSYYGKLLQVYGKIGETEKNDAVVKKMEAL